MCKLAVPGAMPNYGASDLDYAWCTPLWMIAKRANKAYEYLERDPLDKCPKGHTEYYIHCDRYEREEKSRSHIMTRVEDVHKCGKWILTLGTSTYSTGGPPKTPASCKGPSDGGTGLHSRRIYPPHITPKHPKPYEP